VSTYNLEPSPSTDSIKTFDFSTLYTIIPHSKLKDRLGELLHENVNNLERGIVEHLADPAI
jgi:hypothetical protein